jgi:Ca2+-binding EF-hand superfamily protein
MSKQELSALLEDPQRFDEFARAAFRAFDIKQDGHLCADEMSVFLRSAAADLGQTPPDDEQVHDVTKYLSGDDEVISLEKFKAFLGDVLRALVQEAN